MNQHDVVGFDFNFGDDDRSAFLNEARVAVSAMRMELDDRGTATAGAPTPAEQAALVLLEGFDAAVAEFSAHPDMIKLEETHFSEHGLTVPPRFRELSQRFRFYWMRFPTVLKPAPGSAFHKLQCAVQFNPAEKDGHLLPRALMILPDRKFKEIASGNLGLSVKIDETFELKATAGELTKVAKNVGVDADAGVDAALAGKLGFVAGPFNYKWKRAEVDHTAPGASKVFWTLSSSEFTESDDMQFIIVLQVPSEVDQLEVAGALRAYHRLNPAADVGEAFKYLRTRAAEFFRAGAPTNAKATVWNLSRSL
jgi:hypothetical protein